jgi:hypothetical protein
MSAFQSLMHRWPPADALLLPAWLLAAANNNKQLGFLGGGAWLAWRTAAGGRASGGRQQAITGCAAQPLLGIAHLFSFFFPFPIQHSLPRSAHHRSCIITDPSPKECTRPVGHGGAAAQHRRQHTWLPMQMDRTPQGSSPLAAWAAARLPHHHLLIDSHLTGG